MTTQPISRPATGPSTRLATGTTPTTDTSLSTAAVRPPGNMLTSWDRRATGTTLTTRTPWPDPTLYPFQSRWHQHRDGRLHYIDEGEGPTLLFVHGTPSWSFEWRHAIAALRGQFRCVALDHLGFGLSDKPPDAAYRPADHARRLQAFVEALDLRDFTLVVHDFGGPIGLPLALTSAVDRTSATQAAPRVRALVLMNTWMWGHGDNPQVAKISRLVASPLGRFLYRWLNASPRWLLPASFAERKRLTPEVHRHYLAPFAKRRDRMAPWVLGCELAGSEAYFDSLWQRRAALAELPTTIVWGTRDPAIGVAYLQRWKELLPQAQVVDLPVGHFPQEEAPDAVVDAIRAAAR